MWAKSVIPAIVFVLSITSFSMANTTNENRLELETNIKTFLSDNYLLKQASLQDNNTWISIELKSKTWKNPNDTKELIDSVETIVKRHLPLTDSSTPAIGFIIYIDEPVSGAPIAEIIVKETDVTTKHSYYRSLIKVSNISIEPRNKSYSQNIDFRGACGALWSNVKLYYGTGTEKKYIGKIICFSGDYVIIRYPSGNQEPKLRNAIARTGKWYVDSNDPALDAMQYFTCN
ncbi:MAG: hypothetical protein GY853_15415 [PVC group bacterium]|nr:hypothetical protein [PVC group bacterium]